MESRSKVLLGKKFHIFRSGVPSLNNAITQELWQLNDTLCIIIWPSCASRWNTLPAQRARSSPPILYLRVNLHRKLSDTVRIVRTRKLLYKCLLSTLFAHINNLLHALSSCIWWKTTSNKIIWPFTHKINDQTKKSVVEKSLKNNIFDRSMCIFSYQV